LIILAVVVKYFRWDIYHNEATIIMFSFEGPFFYSIAILFGPIFGGIAGMVIDVIGFLTKPIGTYEAFNPLINMVWISAGMLSGLLWRGLKKVNLKILNGIYLTLFLIILTVGITNLLFAKLYPTSGYAEYWDGCMKQLTIDEELYIDNSALSTIGFIAVGSFGLVIHMITCLFITIMFRDKKSALEYYLRVFISVAVPTILSTSMITLILREYHLGKEHPFIFSCLPRFMEAQPKIFYTVYGIIILSLIINKIKGEPYHAEN